MDVNELRAAILDETMALLYERKKSKKKKKNGRRAIYSAVYKDKTYRSSPGALAMLGFRKLANNTWRGPDDRESLERRFGRAVKKLGDDQVINNPGALLMAAKIVGLSLMNKLDWMDISPATERRIQRKRPGGKTGREKK